MGQNFNQFLGNVRHCAAVSSWANSKTLGELTSLGGLKMNKPPELKHLLDSGIKPKQALAVSNVTRREDKTVDAIISFSFLKRQPLLAEQLKKGPGAGNTSHMAWSAYTVSTSTATVYFTMGFNIPFDDVTLAKQKQYKIVQAL